ncbi:uncharacterized protein BDZ99DRAFT_464000 [Mytilinidion resinicola]|uniref:RWD domain-containing protein n=1 Tax=Mytilinidion resinicola TaxID=574789 RepID=A0A6A6YL11_9PEZI|nr:uncharacterized protein BDZ99DRAFT_464000 [Mytilinidion resinicola]KAF2809218.1 hypothetical protein BDZ99DRAFT_464000 [Mytilinidion resinicola]
MADPEDDRRAVELELLYAMYPDQITFTEKSRELKFAQETAALILRLPESYPSSGFPEVVSASDTFKTDLRNRMKAGIANLELAEGEESLDAIIAQFLVLLDQNKATHDQLHTDTYRERIPGSKTVVIWLHHLLATSKRKMALNPAIPGVSGITKPGYPGVMIFSGPVAAVNDHVNTLKQENWQAFQVRYEEEGQLWEFEHLRGIKEVETMGEVVRSIEVDGAGRKDEFLQAVGIK